MILFRKDDNQRPFPSYFAAIEELKDVLSMASGKLKGSDYLVSLDRLPQFETETYLLAVSFGDLSDDDTQPWKYYGKFKYRKWRFIIDSPGQILAISRDFIKIFDKPSDREIFSSSNVNL